jgi:hypothetical protein
MSKAVRVAAAALLLSMSLASGSHAAMRVVHQDRPMFGSKLVELAAQFLMATFAPTPGTARVSKDLEHGCAIDPFGRCLPPSTTSSDLEHGCAIDPFGRPIGNCQGE